MVTISGGNLLYLIGDDFQNINNFLATNAGKMKLIYKRINYLLNCDLSSNYTYKPPAEMNVIPLTASMTPMNCPGCGRSCNISTDKRTVTAG